MRNKRGGSDVEMGK